VPIAFINRLPASAGSSGPTPEDVDLELVVDLFRRTVPRPNRVGYTSGLTAFRNALAERLRCSLMFAESIVDTMVRRGFLRYAGQPGLVGRDAAWTLHDEEEP